MKNKLFILMVILSLCMVFASCEMGAPQTYTITIDSFKSYELKVNQQDIDFTQYFTIKSSTGKNITVTESMLDLSRVDTSCEGSFTVTLYYNGEKATVTFKVVKDGENTENQDTPDTPDTPDDTLINIFNEFEDYSTWNFKVTYHEFLTGEIDYTEYYEYLGDYVLNRYEGEDGTEYVEYLEWNNEEQTYYYHEDNGDGTYTKYDEDSDDFAYYYGYMYLIDPYLFGDYQFTKQDGYYLAINPAQVGNDVLCEYDGYAWVSVKIYVENQKITKVEGVLDDNTIVEYSFYGYGEVDFSLPTYDDNQGGGDNQGEGEGEGENENLMESQTYDPATFDSQNLQDKVLAYNEAIGLPSKGDVNALVVPVQFTGTTITQSQLDKLNKAFNGSQETTGWESVKTYYQKSSYNTLNLSFDIQNVYQTQYNAKYYEKYSKSVTVEDYTYTQGGEELLLLEVLAYLEPLIDLKKYDVNEDGCIDAVYLIYSAPVDFDNGDFYWAYVTWYYGDKTYDDLDAYYYLFAGFDFMDEDVDLYDGMIVNSSTYIHETGHLLGLDDYYDYYEDKGSGQGVGGADMMDYTEGDHSAYSKIMLGWVTPKIVTKTTTITITSLQQSGDCVLIPLNFNNSYFCEYLLIDLYTNDGLNKLHSSYSGTYLYDGASYGARIYHVSSSIDNPYSDDYGSFTDYNNSISKYPLLKLVEADGETNFKSTKGYASQKDLWQTGGVFSTAFKSYTRNDGRVVNFDIQFTQVTQTSCTFTVTFKS